MNLRIRHAGGEHASDASVAFLIGRPTFVAAFSFCFRLALCLSATAIVIVLTRDRREHVEAGLIVFAFVVIYLSIQLEPADFWHFKELDQPGEWPMKTDLDASGVPPEKAFGQHNPSNVQTFKRHEFSADMVLEPGVVVSFADARQQELPGVIKRVEGDQVDVDFNHPLSGHTLNFEVKIIDVEPVGPTH